MKRILVVLSLAALLSLSLVYKTNTRESEAPEPNPPEKKTPATPEQFEFVLPHLSHDEIGRTLREWESKAPELVDVGTFGKTTKGHDQMYIRICNEYEPSEKVVLITAAIHGNEPWSTSTVMAYAGKLITSYGRDESMTKLVDSRTIYFVPVISPDTYPHSRHVDGVDPNRDFPTLKNPEKQSVTPVKNLQDFFLKVKPKAVISGHTFGRVFLVPWGDSKKENPSMEDYKRVASEMSRLSGYRYQRGCEMYNSPIFGTEMDWYHRNGAFAMVMEFGSHQRKPTLEETRSEFERTLSAFVHFVEEAPKVELKQSPAN